MNKRNVGMHTDEFTAKRNILVYLAENFAHYSNGAAKSLLGYAAYPSYQFKAPQGAAFSVAKLVDQLRKDGLVANSLKGHGTYITAKGLNYLKDEITRHDV